MSNRKMEISLARKPFCNTGSFPFFLLRDLRPAEIRCLRKEGSRRVSELCSHEDLEEPARRARLVPRSRAGGVPVGDRGAG